jgi:hypothetical protein
MIGASESAPWDAIREEARSLDVLLSSERTTISLPHSLMAMTEAESSAAGVTKSAFIRKLLRFYNTHSEELRPFILPVTAPAASFDLRLLVAAAVRDELAKSATITPAVSTMVDIPKGAKRNRRAA